MIEQILPNNNERCRCRWRPQSGRRDHGIGIHLQLQRRRIVMAAATVLWILERIHLPQLILYRTAGLLPDWIGLDPSDGWLATSSDSNSTWMDTCSNCDWPRHRTSVLCAMPFACFLASYGPNRVEGNPALNSAKHETAAGVRACMIDGFMGRIQV
jgi:hypothetical protein